jgi:hypothetical protein
LNPNSLIIKYNKYSKCSIDGIGIQINLKMMKRKRTADYAGYGGEQQQQSLQLLEDTDMPHYGGYRCGYGGHGGYGKHLRTQTVRPRLWLITRTTTRRNSSQQS